MNLIRDLEKAKKEKQIKESAVAQLRKRSKDSVARPKAKTNLFTKDPRLQGI
jgi:hypothetical protein|tara:strand:- start:20 stop:175 length:156 start_codon:yes stop_codon:yes gene_type:complete